MFAALTLLLVVPGHAWAQGSGDPKRVAYYALSSLVLGDRATFAKVTLPTDGTDAIVRSAPPTGGERTRIDEQLERVSMSTRLPPLFEGEPVDDDETPPVGARIVYTTQLGSSLVPVVVVRAPEGWRVEPRYWVAERAQQNADIDADTPPMIVKRFMYHLMNRETGKLKALTFLPDTVEELTRNNDMAGADRGHVALLCVEMPVARARDGEVVRMPIGTRITAGSQADEVVYVGLLGSVEVPFRLRKVRNAWKVLPEPYFEWLRAMGSI
jgi:hypothetical protein